MSPTIELLLLERVLNGKNAEIKKDPDALVRLLQQLIREGKEKKKKDDGKKEGLKFPAFPPWVYLMVGPIVGISYLYFIAHILSATAKLFH